MYLTQPDIKNKILLTMDAPISIPRDKRLFDPIVHKPITPLSHLTLGINSEGVPDCFSRNGV